MCSSGKFKFSHILSLHTHGTINNINVATINIKHPLNAIPIITKTFMHIHS